MNKRYSYSIWTKVVQLAFAAVFGAISLSVAGYWIVRLLFALLTFDYSLLEEANLVADLYVSLPFLCAATLIVWVPAMTGLLASISALAMYPSITVREEGFRIHSPLGSSPWLTWDAIKKARKVTLPRTSWMIGIEGLGWLYWPTGFSFWLWMPGIHLTQSIDDYHGLMRVFREKRPDLFGPYR